MRALIIAAAVPFIFLAAPASAQVVTDTMDVQIVITKECTSLVANNLDFGSHGVLDANIDVNTTLSFTCTKDTPYNITMDRGANGASVTAREMKNGVLGSVQYSLFRDAGRTLNWGDTAPNGLAGAATGISQTINIYGRVPPQSTPVSGTYTDTILVSLTY